MARGCGGVDRSLFTRGGGCRRIEVTTAAVPREEVLFETDEMGWGGLESGT